MNYRIYHNDGSQNVVSVKNANNHLNNDCIVDVSYYDTEGYYKPQFSYSFNTTMSDVIEQIEYAKKTEKKVLRMY